MGSLFSGGRTQTQAHKTPYEEKIIDNTMRNDVRDRNTVQTGTGTQSATGTGTVATTGLTGLADQSLTSPIKQFLSKVDLNATQNPAQQLLQSRLNETTPAGYRSARQDVIGDFDRATGLTGANQAMAGRAGPGSFSDRSQKINEQALASGLFNAFDKSKAQQEAAILGLNEAAQTQPFGKARQYSSLLAETPFAQATTGQQDQTKATQSQTDQQTIEAIKDMFKGSTKRDYDRSGFNTQITQQQKAPTALQQLGQTGLTLGAAYLSGGGSLGLGGLGAGKAAAGLGGVYRNKQLGTEFGGIVP